MKFDIRNQSDNSADIYFYGDILSNESEAWSYDDVIPSDVVRQLAELKGKDVNIHISSAGGSVFGGMVIYNSINSLNCYKTVYIDSCACSIASVIAMAGDKIVMPNNSMLMIHPAFCSCCTNAEGMRKQAELLEKVDEQILNIYKTRLRDDYDVEDLKALIKAESWLTAKECAEIFNNIELVDEKIEVFAKASESDFLKNYKNIPESLLAQLEKEEEKDEDEQQQEQQQEQETKSEENVEQQEQQQEEEKQQDKVEEEQIEETQEDEEEQQEEKEKEEIIAEDDDEKIGELQVEEEDDDDVIKIKFVNSADQEEEQEKKEEDQEENNDDQEEEKQDNEEENNSDDNSDDQEEQDDQEEEKQKQEEEQKKKKEEQAQAKKQLQLMMAKMFLNDYL